MRRHKIQIEGGPLFIYFDGRIYRPSFIDKGGNNIKDKFLTPSAGCKDKRYFMVTAYSKCYRYSRLIAQAFLPSYSEDLCVDHIDGNTKNNSPYNLRMVTYSGNSLGHRQKRKKCSSIYRGVSFISRIQKWRACVKKDGISHYPGLFDKEKDAAIARDKKAIELGFHKESLNFPNTCATEVS